jgi:hypothetical protein
MADMPDCCGDLLELHSLRGAKGVWIRFGDNYY